MTNSVAQILRGVFVSYSHEDAQLFHRLQGHLALLRRQGRIRVWHDRQMTPGCQWNQTIDEHLKCADLILLLISSHFLDSDYCYDLEMRRALIRHHAGTARVIPVILRPSDWHDAPFGDLLALPADGKPVTTFRNRDKAFLQIAQGVGDVANSFKRDPKGEAKEFLIRCIVRGDVVDYDGDAPEDFGHRWDRVLSKEEFQGAKTIGEALCAKFQRS